MELKKDDLNSLNRALHKLIEPEGCWHEFTDTHDPETSILTEYLVWREMI